MGTAMRELRTAVMILVQVSWQTPAGDMEAVPARMEDKSANGACIRIKTPIAVGTRLRIQWRFEQFSGTCKYCRNEGREYLVGIQRESVTEPRPMQPEAPPSFTEIPTQVPIKTPKGMNLPVLAAQVLTPKEEAPPRLALQREALLEPGLGVQDLRKGASPGLALQKAALEEKVFQQLAVPEVLQNQAWQASELRLEHRLPESSIPQALQLTAPVFSFERSVAPSTPPVRATRPQGDWDATMVARYRDFAVLRPPLVSGTQAPERKAVRKERKFMGRNWLERAPWHHKQENPAVAPEQSSIARQPNGKESTEMSYLSPPKISPETSGFQVDLLPMEEVYRAAGVVSPQKGYSVHKVVEMLHSEHIKGLSPELKRAAVLMALDAAGVSIEQIQTDAKSRQDALDNYEAEQNKQAEAEWSRRDEENAQIQSELERVKAQYLARINRNLEGVAREKAVFNEWTSTKKLESQSMLEAVQLCAKPAPPKLSEHTPLALAAAATKP
jgi:hypothetical protein